MRCIITQIYTKETTTKVFENQYIILDHGSYPQRTIRDRGNWRDTSIIYPILL